MTPDTLENMIKMNRSLHEWQEESLNWSVTSQTRSKKFKRWSYRLILSAPRKPMLKRSSVMPISTTLAEKIFSSKDSAAINVSIYPSLIRRSAFTNEYNPSIILESEFSINQNRFWKQISFQLSEISDISETLNTPGKFALSQNYPNPFNPVTKINYELPITNYVNLSIHNLLGQKVVTLINEEQNAGHHQVEWDASRFASGIYYYRLEAGDFVNVKKMIILK